MLKSNPYSVLGLKPGCSQAEIKKAYKVKCLENHPDKGGCGDQMAEINDAYSKLMGGGVSAPKNFVNEKPVVVNVTLEELASEAVKQITVFDKVQCACVATQPECVVCKGEGKQTVSFAFLSQTITCQNCHGHGFCGKWCNDCKLGFKLEPKILNLKLSAHFKEHEVRGIDKYRVKIAVVPDSTFQRVNNDLRTMIQLNLEEAMFGYERIINHPCGKQLKVSNDSVTQPGDTRVFPGYGMTKQNKLLVTFVVKLPTSGVDKGAFMAAIGS